MLCSWFRDHGTIPPGLGVRDTLTPCGFAPLQELSKASKWRIRHPNDIRVLLILTAVPRVTGRTYGGAGTPPKRAWRGKEGRPTLRKAL